MNVEDATQDVTLRSTASLLRHCRGELGKVIAGQESVIDQVLITVLCRGHALIEGVPGIAKTLMVKLLGRVLGLPFRRVQATPDLMPADILGTMVLRSQTGEFALHRGPVFTSFLLVDEINRMPPRTQSALLECMEERQVTIDGVEHCLADGFTVFATQNPIDFEGTYPLPEAQLDRFLLKIRATYPTAEDELLVLERHHADVFVRGIDQIHLEPVDPQLVADAQREVRAITIEPALSSYLLNIVRKTREWPALLLGASPRASLSLMLAAQAYAALEGRDYLVPDDVKQAVLPVLRHRILLRPEAELEGYDPDRVLTDVIASIAVPQR